MQHAQLALVLALRRQDTASPGQQVIVTQAACAGPQRPDLLVDRYHGELGRLASAGTQGRTHAPELFGMGIAANLLHQPGRFTVVVLAQMQAALPCCFYQMFTTAFQQGRIGRIGNCLLHDRCIDNYPLHARWPDHLGPLGGLNALCWQFFHADFAQALAPALQA